MIPRSRNKLSAAPELNDAPLSGDEGARTPDIRLAKAALSQLSYIPVPRLRPRRLRLEVGLCGLEPQTFPLSEGCSNQLS
jgi:hypothetical protein